MSGQAAISEQAGEILVSVHQHRLLRTSQIRDMHAPHTGIRRTQQTLYQLAGQGLLAAAHLGGPGKHWHLTEPGAQVVERIAGQIEDRAKLLTNEQAGGMLAAHTLAVNDVGIAYLKAARERGDEFGPYSWRHEIAHPIGPSPGRTKGEQLIADALLSYLRITGDRVHQHHRFVELDRATMPAEHLVAKLHRYQRLRTYTPPVRRGQPASAPAWTASYPSLPGVQIVLTGKPRETLIRRLQLALALHAADAQLRGDDALGVSLCLLEDLQARGPFAAIWRRATEPTVRVNWLGEPDGAGR